MIRKKSGKQKILEYFLSHIGEVVDGKQELQRVSGISEWARRVRELRVEDGYEILTYRDKSNLKPWEYILISPLPDREKASKWKRMNQIRRDPQYGARERMLALFQENVGHVITKDDLQYVSHISEWARRIRELRVEQGYRISSHHDRPDLKLGEYVLETLEQTPVQDRIDDKTRMLILERDEFRCVKCGAKPGNGIYLEVHHITPVEKGGNGNATNLETLCNSCHKAASGTDG